jgi:hypothetical protein
MNDMSRLVSLPLDEDGCLRRECPVCERQFKWWPTPDHKVDAEEMRGEIEAYICPHTVTSQRRQARGGRRSKSSACRRLPWLRRWDPSCAA